jgi:hypothetical protein
VRKFVCLTSPRSRAEQKATHFFRGSSRHVAPEQRHRARAALRRSTALYKKVSKKGNSTTMATPRLLVVLCLAIVATIATAFAPSEPAASSVNSKWSVKTSTYAPLKRVGFATPRECFISSVTQFRSPPL